MATVPEVKYGIKQRGPSARTVPQVFALTVGLVLIALGVIGFFVTGFGQIVAETDTALLGLFYLNPFHNVVNIALGLIALLAGLALTPPATEGVLFILAGVLIVVTVLGYLGYLDQLLSIRPGLSPDNVLHLVLGVVTLLFSNPQRVLTG